ncbi:MAG TPA: nuclear transport factor 2 family protein [Candidatus Sulfotelmatobacter sp.]|nr:nuclear transport factor 2 family protein [Candidatus Sulfotelmatobacter sp.]
MNRLALAFSLLLISTLSANAQQKKDDASAVRATVTNYIEAYFTGDAPRMKQTLHPHYLKHMIHGDIPMREKTGEQMVTEVRRNGPADLSSSQKSEQVTVLDVANDIASAKLVTPGWTDYMTLSKVNGDWKILSVVQQIN